MHLYVHVPFCARRCSYCDFAIAVRRVVPSERFVAAVLREWDAYGQHPMWAAGRAVETLYFGGGTPSRLDPSGVARILDAIGRDRRIEPGAEITLEANPDDVTRASAGRWRDAGVTRVSLGVQSFDAGVLAWMHRTHTPEQSVEAVAVLRDAGIGEVSLDLIFGLPAALGRCFDRDLARALALRPEHVSLYGLTVEPGTPLGRWAARGEAVSADEDRYAAEYLAAHAALVAAGYEHYEVSNAGLPGRRARHNSAYWRRAPYLGLGPSAHSAVGAERWWNLRDWAAYVAASDRGESVVAGREALTPEADSLEEVYLGLRTSEGVPADRIGAGAAAAWTAAGWAERHAGRIRLTPEGWLRLDALAAATPLSGGSA
ncbi:MAG TPA: radical SAM family heme chaperone HemW [Gemmatimonadales bacterium]|nr:radical SAM family heme chaperone HemW [Gemmatimonadales bacterium]